MAALARIFAGIALLSGPAADARDMRIEIRIEGHEIRLADLADVPSGLEDLASRVVARIPCGADRLELDGKMVSGILRRSAPGLRLVPKQAGTLAFATDGAQCSRAGELSGQFACSALKTSVAEGEYLAASMLSREACEAGRGPNAALQFDRQARALRATEAMPAGTYLGRILVPAEPVAPAGSEMLLRVSSGPVVIEREVRTLQPARNGEHVFAQAYDGAIVSAQIEAGKR